MFSLTAAVPGAIKFFEASAFPLGHGLLFVAGVAVCFGGFLAVGKAWGAIVTTLSIIIGLSTIVFSLVPMVQNYDEYAQVEEKNAALIEESLNNRYSGYFWIEDEDKDNIFYSDFENLEKYRDVTVNRKVGDLVYTYVLGSDENGQPDVYNRANIDDAESIKYSDYPSLEK